MATAAGTKQGIQSIEIGVRVLVALRVHGDMALGELALASKMSASKVYRYLVSFGRSGLTEQDEATGRYRLGPMALELGLARMAQNDGVRIGAPELARLAARVGATATLSVWGNMGPTVVRWEESRQLVSVNLRVGSVLPIATTATGLVFAAWRPAAQIDDLLRRELRLAPRRAGLSLKSMSPLLEKVRADGIACIDGSLIPGICALSAPVFNHDRQLVLAMSLMSHSGSMDLTPDGKAVAALKQSARWVSEQLSCAD